MLRNGTDYINGYMGTKWTSYRRERVKRKTKGNKQRSWISITIPKTLEKNKKWVVEGDEKGWRSHVRTC